MCVWRQLWLTTVADADAEIKTRRGTMQQTKKCNALQDNDSKKAKGKGGAEAPAEREREIEGEGGKRINENGQQAEAEAEEGEGRGSERGHCLWPHCFHFRNSAPFSHA